MAILKQIRLLGISLAVLLLTLTFPIVANAAPTNVHYGETVISQMSNANVLLPVYQRMVDGVENAQDSIDVTSHQVTTNDVNTLFTMLRNDYPEFFWLGTQCRVQLNGNYVTAILPTYIVEGSALSNAKTAVNNRVATLTQGLAGKSDYEKSLILHDRVAASVTYGNANGTYSQSAYSALIEGTAVCAGYAKMYEYLLHQVGIPAVSVNGQSLNPGTNRVEPHEWTLAKLDGQWYYTDVTWDDQGSELYRAYLNITTQQLNEDHTITEFASYLPTATATSANYFTRINRKFNRMDTDTVAKDMKNNNGKAEFYITGNMDTFQNDLKSLSSILATVNSDYYTCNVYMLGREVHLHALTKADAATTTTSKANSGAALTTAALTINTAANTTSKNHTDNIVTANANSAHTGTPTDSNDATQSTVSATSPEDTTDSTVANSHIGSSKYAPNGDADFTVIIIIVSSVGGAAVLTVAMAGTVIYIKKKRP